MPWAPHPDASGPQARSVAEVLLRMLASHGVEVVYGLPGVHNLAFWDTDGGPRILGVRHEQAAGYAADGLARSTGRLGVALTTTGPGAMNVLAAFGEAAVSHSSIIVIASDVSTALRREEPRGILHEMRDQAAAFAPLATHTANGPMAINCSTAEEAIEALSSALAHHRGRGEVAAYIGVPTDLLSQTTTYGVSSDLRTVGRLELAPAAGALDAAQRPVVWLGGGAAALCDRPGGEDLLRALVERLAAPVVTSFAGRGVLAGHPLIIEAPVHEPEVHAVLAQADALLVLGSDFDGMNTRNWRLPVPDAVVTINHSAQPIATNLSDGLHLIADLGVIAELTPRLGQRQPWLDVSDVTATMRDRLRADDRGALGMELVAAVETAWPDHAALVVDMCVAGYWLAGYARQPRPRRLAYPVGWGTLGFALPAAMGPASVGIPTLAVTGDGGAMFALGELATYAQERLPITLLVNDDGGYGMLRYDQQVFGHPERGVDLVAPDWITLAHSFGIDGVEVHGFGEPLAQALHFAYAENLAGRPALVLVRGALHPPRTTSPRWNEGM